ncbi:branched-chain alpha-keto acid dehydrogenase E1-alpha subunit [Exidia glandulosa HHB12029]|uniref:2-oxoisovalerate dehydrogenase subunit alpha n=1 Tax=Exidia glandulosa HHB12029 TaxID=1314781 RepID=A0A165QMH0_EXIGL|nr:branched-chain alpha-keto acid dehydrogenase E1-alpha subunit [Exidia glandulosa HHB12029]
MASLRAIARRGGRRALTAIPAPPAFVPLQARRLHDQVNHGTLPHTGLPLTPKLEFFNSVASGPIPTFRVLDGEGRVLEGAEEPEIDRELARRLYENMNLLPALDNLLYNVQRQGKISFYMTSYGEEASIIGSAAALDNADEVLGQYREMGVLLWRGYTLDSVMAQCLGNQEDIATKGRQMPVHFGSPTHHFMTISSPLATQIPQAAGVGYALRRMRKPQIAVCYFGEGAASEGDFHAGLLLASTVPSPTLYFARNNGFAISTPAAEQYHGDGIASRGPGYGIDTIRVDGNDVLAVYVAVKEARRRCLEQGRAVLVEAMTYRVGHHSTSDDSFAYRSRAEVEDRKKIDNPHIRLRLYLQSKGWWTAEEEEELKSRLKKEVLTAFKRAEKLKRFPLETMFGDIYAGEEPWNIKEQKEELARLLKKYGNTWEPWKNELQKFENNGKEFTEKS